MDASKMLAENKEVVDSELERFLPKKVDEKWVHRHIGKGSYDVRAVNAFLSKPVWDFLERGGKRWRPLLMFLSCAAVGGNPKTIGKFAVIPELIHNGSLIADDVEDDSVTRRGKPALHIAYGTDIAVNIGTFLYYLPLQVIKNSKLDNDRKAIIYELINHEMLKLHFGQGMDIYWHKAKNPDASESRYFSMCANKTGTLARLSAKLGAILGKGNERQVFALGKFAEALGIAFQIQDDILNLKGGVGKDFGEDITEGKMSLPLIRTLSVANKRDKKVLRRILNKHTRDKGEMAIAIGIIKHYQGMHYSSDVADRIIGNAWRKLEPLLPASPAKGKLKKLAGFMLEREH